MSVQLEMFFESFKTRVLEKVSQIRFEINPIRYFASVFEACVIDLSEVQSMPLYRPGSDS